MQRLNDKRKPDTHQKRIDGSKGTLDAKQERTVHKSKRPKGPNEKMNCPQGEPARQEREETEEIDEGMDKGMNERMNERMDERMEKMDGNTILDLWEAYDPVLLERAYRELLTPAFPSTDEREPLQSLKIRLEDRPPSPQPETHVMLCGQDWRNPHEASIDGVLIFEVYRRSKLGLITYITTRNNRRGQGMGRELFKQAQKRFHGGHGGQHGTCLLAEVHNPQRVKAEADSMDPSGRLRFFGRLGGRLIPIQYVQPPLSHQGRKVDAFLLLAFPKAENSLERKPLILFLEEFHQALSIDTPWMSDDFHGMVETLNRLNNDPEVLSGWRQLGVEIGCPLLEISEAESTKPTP